MISFGNRVLTASSSLVSHLHEIDTENITAIVIAKRVAVPYLSIVELGLFFRDGLRILTLSRHGGGRLTGVVT